MLNNRFRCVFVFIFILGCCLILTGCGKSEEEYKKAAVTMNYDEFVRKPDSFKDQPIAFIGSVQNVKENGKDVDLLFLLGKTPILAHYKLKDNEERIVAHDTIRVWGEFQKVSSQKLSELSSETSVIEIDTKYILRPKWHFLKDLFGYNTWTTKEDGNVNPMDTKSLQVSISANKVNSNNVEIEGTMHLNSTYFPFKGIIDDNGVGEFEYVDKQKVGTGKKGKLNIINRNEIEIETVSFEQEVTRLFGNQKELVKVESGKYLFKRKF